MREKIEKIAAFADNILVLIMRYFAAALILIGLYVVYDNFHTEKYAFASYDLLQYKPKEQGESGEYDFADIYDINKDTVAWLTIYDTHIDYPVVQGDDNFEYINKDVFGKFSLSGSIYLDSESSGFEDWYSIIYGHHMDNGAMFGDLDLFTDEDFFNTHTEGYLQTPELSYKLDLRAVILADAYDEELYHYQDSEESRTHMLEAISDKAKFTRETGTDKLIVLSTCNSGATFGRLLLVYDAEPTNEPVKRTEPAESEGVILTAVGHLSDSSHFALVNLVCVIASVLVVIGAVFRRGKTAVGHIAAAVTAVLCIVSAVVFIKTENITKELVLTDSYSLIMQVILLVSYIVWVVSAKLDEKNINDKNTKVQNEQEPEGGL